VTSRLDSVSLCAYVGAMSIAVEHKKKVRTEAELEALSDYFSSGSRLAWVIDSDRELVEICHSPTQRRLLGPGGSLNGEDLLHAFQYPVGDLFEEWEW
jgi:hypothetical protein